MKPFHLLPPQAATNAQSVDVLFWALVALSLAFALPICATLIFFAVRYRHGRDVNRQNPPRKNIALELAWTLTPTFLGIGFFVWAAQIYFNNSRPPSDAMEIYVVGKQWMWKIQHPNGRREINALHVPAGRDVRLIMTSQDVIHDFFVPAFRLKQDVLPGRYTSMWFKTTTPGTYHLFCAEYCGSFHSRMGGWVTVMKPADYQKWLSSGDAQPRMESAGERLFTRSGCSGCHGPNSNVRAPLLDGIYNHPVAVQNGAQTQTVIADESYLRDSILLPNKQIAAGFRPIMPSYAGRLNEDELLQIIAYLKTMKPEISQSPNAPNAGKSGNAASANYAQSWAGGKIQ